MKKIKGIILVLCLLLSFISMAQPAYAKKFDKAAAKKKISVTYKKTSNGILAIYKNKNSTAVQLSATMRFLDGNKKDIQKETKINYCLGGKSTGTIFFQAPLDSYGNYVVYNSYKGSFSVNKSKYKNYSNKISISQELKVVEGIFTAVNMSGKNLSNIETTIVFYDGKDNIIGCKIKYLNCFEKNSIDQFSIDYVDNIIPAKAKVYINCAY